MKKFFLLHYGFETPTPEIMDAWNTWFASYGGKFVDPGNRFGLGREISKNGTRELPLDSEAITGYSIIEAESMEEAEMIAKACPGITGIRVYEAMSMA